MLLERSEQDLLSIFINKMEMVTDISGMGWVASFAYLQHQQSGERRLVLTSPEAAVSAHQAHDHPAGQGPGQMWGRGKGPFHLKGHLPIPSNPLEATAKAVSVKEKTARVFFHPLLLLHRSAHRVFSVPDTSPAWKPPFQLAAGTFSCSPTRLCPRAVTKHQEQNSFLPRANQ